MDVDPNLGQTLDRTCDKVQSEKHHHHPKPPRMENVIEFQKGEKMKAKGRSCPLSRMIFIGERLVVEHADKTAHQQNAHHHANHQYFDYDQLHQAVLHNNHSYLGYLLAV